jgi:hypothetical protein
MAMTQKQAAEWVKQELAKITTPEQIEAHLSAYAKSLAFFESAAGKASAERDPHARAARHALAAEVAQLRNT